MDKNTDFKQRLARRLTMCYTAEMVCYYVANTTVLSFMVDLLQFQHVPVSSIALLVGLAYLLSLVAQSLLANFADNHPNVSLNIISALIMAVVCGLLTLNLLVSQVHPVLSAALFVLIAMSSASNPAILNAICTRYQSFGIPVRYSIGRGGGSVATAGSGLLLGLLVDAKGAGALFVVGIVCSMLAVALVLALPDANRYRPEDALPVKAKWQERVSMRAILRRNPTLCLFLLTTILAYTSMNGAWTYQKSIIAAVGGNSSLYGASVLLVAISEVPMAILFSRLTGRFGIHRLLLVSFLFYAVKPLINLIGLQSGSLPVLYLACLTHVCSSGILFPGGVYFANLLATDRDRVRVQAFFAMTAGIGATVGNFTSSAVFALGGLPLVLAVSTIVGALGVLAYLAMLIVRKRTKNALDMAANP